MDYSLIRVFFNDAIDSLFKFFYKFFDFGKVLADTFMAFVEIWFNFGLFFVKIFLCMWYLLVFVFEKILISTAPVFFWRKSGSSTGPSFKRAYDATKMAPVSGAFGRSAVDASKRAVSATVKTADVAAQSASSVVVGRYSNKPNFFIRFFSAIGRGIARFFKGIGSFFASVGQAIASKFVPVKEAPVGRKSLVEDYLKQYDTKKSR